MPPWTCTRWTRRPGVPRRCCPGRLGPLDLMERLLARGARPDPALLGPILERVHNNPDGGLGAGATPLMRAARKGDLDAMRVLLAHGASVDARTARGTTALMYLAGFGRADPLCRVRHASRDRCRVRRGAEAADRQRRRRRCGGRVRADRAAHRGDVARPSRRGVSPRTRRTPRREGRAGAHPARRGARRGGRARGGAPPVVRDDAAALLRRYLGPASGAPVSQP